MHALGSLAGVGGIVDGARLPVLILRENALEVERMVDVGEAELDVVALYSVLEKDYASVAHV